MGDLFTIPDCIRDLYDRVAAAWAEARHVLVISHPGVGTTMVARRLAAREPVPTDRWESLAVLRWAYGDTEHARERAASCRAPFRAPHHTVSVAGLLGGWARRDVRPGEATLAHGGVLFLDEIPEFSRVALSGLTEPLDTGEIACHKARGRVVLPARFRVIATAYPCPCGFKGHPERACICHPRLQSVYRSRRDALLTGRQDAAIVDVTGAA